MDLIGAQKEIWKNNFTLIEQKIRPYIREVALDVVQTNLLHEVEETIQADWAGMSIYYRQGARDAWVKKKVVSIKPIKFEEQEAMDKYEHPNSRLTMCFGMR